jgi:hypothetical protein
LVGVPAADGRKLLRPVAGELVLVDLDGVDAWVTRAGADGLATATPLRRHVRLLPAFDAYVLAPHGRRRHTWPVGLHGRISHAAGWTTPTLLVDGRIAGVWSHERRGRSILVEIEAFVPLSKTVRAAAEAHARAYEALVSAPLEVRWVKEAAGDGNGPPLHPVE